MMAKERKSNLLTVRLTDDDMYFLDLLSDRMSKSRSDIILRACKFLINLGNQHVIDKNLDERDGRKVHRVNVRMSDSDMERLRTRSDETGIAISSLIREAIRAFAGGSGISY